MNVMKENKWNSSVLKTAVVWCTLGGRVLRLDCHSVFDFGLYSYTYVRRSAVQTLDVWPIAALSNNKAVHHLDCFGVIASCDTVCTNKNVNTTYDALVLIVRVVFDRERIPV